MYIAKSKLQIYTPRDLLKLNIPGGRSIFQSVERHMPSVSVSFTQCLLMASINFMQGTNTT